ncbi:MAG TPA: hypothetical protein VFS14_02135 [Candidatus Saccharimonadales bacterium]|nr:hypothetical protein [Candidatus Saccharimonadales bacterium]
MTLQDWQLLVLIGLLFMLARRLMRAIPGNTMMHGRRGYAALLVVFTSPVMLALLGHFGENRPWSDFTHLSTLPWSVVFGDGLVLPLAVLVAGASAPDWYDKPLATSRLWRWGSALAGLAFGIAFHHWDAANYRRDGYAEYVDSLTKAWHDFAVFSILFALLLWLAVLVFSYAERPHKLVFGVLLLMQAGLMAADTMRGLKPSNMHAACDLACGSQNLGVHLHDLLAWLVPIL